MSQVVGKAATQVGKAAANAANVGKDTTLLRKGAKRDPELYVCLDST